MCDNYWVIKLEFPIPMEIFALTLKPVSSAKLFKKYVSACWFLCMSKKLVNLRIWEDNNTKTVIAAVIYGPRFN
jgi:hypothetical protein